MYHPYKKGYNVLPSLEKLEEEPFGRDVFYKHYIEEKRKALLTQKVFLLNNINNEIFSAFADFIQEHGPDWIDPPYTLANVAMQVQEDIAIHRIEDGRDWLAATHICFPSGWRPEEKIGRPLDEIHEPIPGMNLSNGYRLAEAASQRGPFRRFVWTPIYEYKINFHPDLPKKPFDRKNPLVYVKVEKQITWPVPELGAFFFILRQHVIEPDLQKLFKACDEMDEDQKAYKGVTQELIDTMGDIINGTIQSPHFTC